MTDEDALSRVQDIVRAALNDPALTITPATTARDVPGWDSVKQVMIILEVEQAFDIALRSREIDRITCVGDLVTLVQTKLAA